MGIEDVTVHSSKIKSIQIFIHVDAMLCDPQPKGLKRKYPEEEDSDPPKSYSQQRQDVFELSYEKLCRFRQNPDSSLLRYVLIFNTMRRVEQDMERDGIKINCLPGGPFLPASCELATLDPPPGTLEGAPPDEYDRCVVDFDGPASGRATPFVRGPEERPEPGALWTEDSDRLTSLNWSSVFSSSVSSPVRSTLANGQPEPAGGDSASEEGGASLHTLMPATAASNLSIAYSSSSSTSPSTSPSSGTASPSAGSSPTSSEDEIFGDIDLTLYDFDLLSPLSPPNVRMAPVSAEELMRSLSSEQGAPRAPPPYFKNEHFATEEHVATSVRS